MFKNTLKAIMIFLCMTVLCHQGIPQGRFCFNPVLISGITELASFHLNFNLNREQKLNKGSASPSYTVKSLYFHPEEGVFCLMEDAVYHKLKFWVKFRMGNNFEL
jgi:hypothetical protein